jgi:hypothetical protein
MTEKKLPNRIGPASMYSDDDGAAAIVGILLFLFSFAIACKIIDSQFIITGYSTWAIGWIVSIYLIFFKR